MPEIDTFNEFMVGTNRDNLIIMLPPKPGQLLTKERALGLAAWLVALADPGGELFDDVLEAVMQT